MTKKPPGRLFYLLFHDLLKVYELTIFGYPFNNYPERFAYIIIIKSKFHFIFCSCSGYLRVPVQRSTKIFFSLAALKLL